VRAANSFLFCILVCLFFSKQALVTSFTMRALSLLLLCALLLALLQSAVAQTTPPTDSAASDSSSSSSSSSSSTGTAALVAPPGDSDAAVAITVLMFIGVLLGIVLHINHAWVQPMLRAYRVKGTAGAWAEFMRVPGAPPVAEV
jgi:hypothetical protein